MCGRADKRAILFHYLRCDKQLRNRPAMTHAPRSRPAPAPHGPARVIIEAAPEAS